MFDALAGICKARVSEGMTVFVVAHTQPHAFNAYIQLVLRDTHAEYIEVLPTKVGTHVYVMASDVFNSITFRNYMQRVCKKDKVVIYALALTPSTAECKNFGVRTKTYNFSRFLKAKHFFPQSIFFSTYPVAYTHQYYFNAAGLFDEYHHGGRWTETEEDMLFAFGYKYAKYSNKYLYMTAIADEELHHECVAQYCYRIEEKENRDTYFFYSSGSMLYEDPFKLGALYIEAAQNVAVDAYTRRNGIYIIITSSVMGVKIEYVGLTVQTDNPYMYSSLQSAKIHNREHIPLLSTFRKGTTVFIPYIFFVENEQAIYDAIEKNMFKDTFTIFNCMAIRKKIEKCPYRVIDVYPATTGDEAKYVLSCYG